MGSGIQLLVCFALMVIDGTSGLSMNIRMKTVETHLELLEVRTDGQGEEIRHIVDTMSELNGTLLEIKQCFPGEREQTMDTSDSGKRGHDDTYDDNSYKNSEIIMHALKQEKLYVRDQVQYLSKNINTMQEDVMKKVEREVKHMNQTATEVVSHLNDVQEKLNTSLTTSIESVSAEQTYLKNLVKTIKSDIEKLIETEIQSLKSAIASSISDLKTSLIEINESKLEDLERHKHVLQSGVDHGVIKCEATWTMYLGSCYKHFADHKSWDDAKQACEHENAFLVDVVDQQEMSFLESLVENATKHLTNLYEKWFWLGLTDKDEEGSWIWDRTGAKATYLNWYPGEPSNMVNDFDCAFAGYEAPDKWGDVACRSSRNWAPGRTK